MKITVTATTTSLKSLIETALYDFKQIEEGRIKDKESSNNFGVYIKNTGTSSIFIENFFSATIGNSIEIVSGTDFSLDVSELSKLNLMVASGTNEVKLIIT